MPMADPLRRRLYSMAISRAKTALTKQHSDEYKALIDDNYSALLRQHGLEEE